MRRTIFLALLAALLLAPTASAANPIRDCEDDGILQGDYTPSQLRQARSNLPTDIDEYSDCRDVLSRAIAASASASGPSGGTGGGGGNGAGATSGGGTPDPTAQSSPAPSNPTPSTGKDPGIVTGPSTPEDWKAIDGANRHGDDAVVLSGRPVSPGSTRLAAQVGRNGLPSSLIFVVALLGTAALVAFVLPVVRRRGFTHRET
jgi:hypothetical protein